MKVSDWNLKKITALLYNAKICNCEFEKATDVLAALLSKTHVVPLKTRQITDFGLLLIKLASEKEI